MHARDFPKLLRVAAASEFVQPEMHFKATTGLERVFDAVKENEALVESVEVPMKTFTQFENKVSHPSFAMGKTRYSFATMMNSTQRARVGIAEAARQLRSTLHNKTHFQAVIALVNRQSRSLAQKSDKKQPATLTIETEDALARADERLNAVQRQHQQQQEQEERQRSLPRIGKRVVDNTPPGRELTKRKSLGNLWAGYGTEVGDTTGNSASMAKQGKTHGGNKRKSCGVRFVFPALGTGAGTVANEDKMTATEELGKRVLKLCSVLRSKSPKLGPMLRKGEGKLMSGFGMTNRETYDKVFGS